jgi:2-polyprenyl-3-methyl-5-hydroxy-6-metoxy-1,4-benzoquinol methylase
MINYLVKKISHNTDKNSVSHAQRAKRFSFFLAKMNQLPKPISILDIGGTIGFWEAMNFQEKDIHITLLNLEVQPVNNPNFTSITGDATNLNGIADKAFDIVFSNSVIEHLYSWENQQKMAKEVLRVGKYHFIQTPNYWFPIEPHWVFPFFQFLPRTIRVWLTHHFSLGHIPRMSDRAKAINQVEEIRLLRFSEYRMLFPHSAIYIEKFAGFNKSFIAHNFH